MRMSIIMNIYATISTVLCYQNHSKPTFLLPQTMPLELNRQKSVGHDMANDLGTRNIHQNAASLQPCHMQVFMEKSLKVSYQYAFQTFIHQLQHLAQAKGGHPGMTASVGASGPSQIFDNINQLLILKYWAVFQRFKKQRSAKVN